MSDLQPTGNGGGWRRLDARMLLVHPIQELVRGIPALLALIVAGDGLGRDIAGLAGAVGLIGLGIVRWFTTRYRVTDEQVQIVHGLVRRRTASARLDRVRTVDVTSHLLHRALGLGRVVIGTGQNDHRKNDTGLVLDALTVPAAEQLRRELLRRGTVPATVDPTTADPTTADPTTAELLRLQPRWTWYAPFTLSGAVTGLALVAVAWRLVSQTHVDPEKLGALRAIVRHYRDTPLWIDVVESVLGIVTVIAALSIAGYLLAFWNFRLTRRDDGMLHVTRGLLTTRATTIEERRLHGVELSEPLLLRAVYGARCLAIATGLRVGRGAEHGGTLLVPPAPRAVAERTAVHVLGTATPFGAPLRAHARTARRRRVIRATVPAAPVAVAAALTAALGALPWATSAGVLVLPVAWLLALDRYRSLGHQITERHLITRSGSLVRRRSVLERDAVIGWTEHRSFLQRRAGLTTLVATTAAGRQGYRLTDLTEAQAAAVVDEVTPALTAGFALSEA